MKAVILGTKSEFVYKLFLRALQVCESVPERLRHLSDGSKQQPEIPRSTEL
jgi:hypothetical protein